VLFSLAERTDLIVHGVTDVRDVQAMLMSGTTRKRERFSANFVSVLRLR
jgi:hypothetical protein